MPRASLLLIALAAACRPAGTELRQVADTTGQVGVGTWWFSEDTSESKVDGQRHILNSRVSALLAVSPTTAEPDTGAAGLAWFSCSGMRPRFSLALPARPKGSVRLRLGDSVLSLDAAGLYVADRFVSSEYGASAASLTLADTLWIEFTPEDESVPWTMVVPIGAAHELVGRLQRDRCDVLDS